MSTLCRHPHLLKGVHGRRARQGRSNSLHCMMVGDRVRAQSALISFGADLVSRCPKTTRPVYRLISPSRATAADESLNAAGRIMYVPQEQSSALGGVPLCLGGGTHFPVRTSRMVFLYLPRRTNRARAETCCARCCACVAKQPRALL